VEGFTIGTREVPEERKPVIRDQHNNNNNNNNNLWNQGIQTDRGFGKQA
jgi:hypothetical protein